MHPTYDDDKAEDLKVPMKMFIDNDGSGAAAELPTTSVCCVSM